MFKLYIHKNFFIRVDAESLRGIDLMVTTRKLATIYYDNKPKKKFRIEEG